MNSGSQPSAKSTGNRPLLIVLAGIFVLGLFESCRYGDAGRASRKIGAKTGVETSARETADVSAAQLIANLAVIDCKHGALTAEQSVIAKQTLRQLVAKGPPAIPAIREFLGRNQDLVFDAPGSADLAGTTSLRLALLGALEEIGGVEATATLRQTFQTTADPAELATLARWVESIEPGQHRVEFVSAAKQTLALAASGNWDGRDVGPLFEILRTFGGLAEVAELEKYANTWFVYTSLTLAQWPGGAGIPWLINLAQNTNGLIPAVPELYQRMLAQAAVDNAVAADALVTQARRNKIGVAAWPAVGKALAGETLYFAKSYFVPPPAGLAPSAARRYHKAVRNQNYVEVATADNATTDVREARIRLVDRLLDATSNPAALDALDGARISLSARLARVKGE